MPESELRDENDRRSTHVVYRIGSEFSYQETPCFCPARAAHSVLDTQVIRPVEDHGHPKAGRAVGPLICVPCQVGENHALCRDRSACKCVCNQVIRPEESP